MKTMSTTTSLTVAVLMCCTAALGTVAQPASKAVDKGNAISLEAIVPVTFGDWSLLPDQGLQVVNPQTKEILDRLYSQLLTRTYVDKSGYRIMLSLAYGDDQRGGLQAHRPEVCYPAQGFKVTSLEDGVLTTSFGALDVRRLVTVLGPRKEPVTYWLTVGDEVIQTALQKRIAQIRLGLTGQIPDGLLFRVSSIDADNQHAFSMQQKFVAELLASTASDARKKLSGLTSGA